MKISVAMCTYNGQRYLREQLRSLLDQQKRPDELIVCDDRSTDDTVGVIKEFALQSPFRVQLHINDRRLGHAQNFAKALSLCTGDVLFPCDQDDIWKPQKISGLSRILAKNEHVGMAACDSQIVSSDLKIQGYTMSQSQGFTRQYREAVDAGKAFEVFIRTRSIPGHTMAIRASLREVFLPIPDSMNHDEWILLLSAAMGGVVLVPEAWVCYRLHERQTTGGGKKRSLFQWWRLAPKIPAEYFSNEAHEFELLQHRMRKFEHQLLNSSSMLAAVREKIDFLQKRAEMRRSRWARFFLIMSQLLRGRYHRLARGWISLARDIAG